MLICNLTKKQYLDPEVFGEEPSLKAIVESWQGSMTGLTVLLADGNNRGGGDLRVDHALIGSWSGDAVAILDDSTAMEVAQVSMRDIVGTWTDLSAGVIAVISQAEGWIAGHLDPTSVIPRRWQRRCLQFADKPLLSSTYWHRPLQSLAELFAIFGQPPALTPGVREKRLQEGLNDLARVLRAPAAYCVEQLTLQPKADGSGLEEALLELKSVQGQVSSTTLPLYFVAGPQGTVLPDIAPSASPADVLTLLFPSLGLVQGRLHLSTNQGA